MFNEVEARLSTFLDPFKRLEIVRNAFDLGKNPNAREANFSNVYDIFDQFDQKCVDELSAVRYEFIGKCLVDLNFKMDDSARMSVDTRRGTQNLAGVGNPQERERSNSVQLTNNSEEMGNLYDEYMKFEEGDTPADIHEKMKKKLSKKNKAMKRAQKNMATDGQCCKADKNCAIF